MTRPDRVVVQLPVGQPVEIAVRRLRWQRDGSTVVTTSTIRILVGVRPAGPAAAGDGAGASARPDEVGR